MYKYDSQLFVPLKKFNHAKFKRFLKGYKPTNRSGWNKPKGALWTSTYKPRSKYKSGWAEFVACEDMDWQLSKALLIIISKKARLCIINCFEDLNNLKEYTDADKKRFVSDDLDFSKLVKDYDLVHLTEEGQEHTRFSSPGLYGWDCECSVILNPEVIESYKTIDI